MQNARERQRLQTSLTPTSRKWFIEDVGTCALLGRRAWLIHVNTRARHESSHMTYQCAGWCRLLSPQRVCVCVHHVNMPAPAIKSAAIDTRITICIRLSLGPESIFAFIGNGSFGLWSYIRVMNVFVEVTCCYVFAAGVLRFRSDSLKLDLILNRSYGLKIDQHEVIVWPLGNLPM